MGVGGEVRWYPVEDYPKPRAVAGVDEVGEVRRGTEAPAGRELAQWLVAPGAAKRVLHDRQQLDMGEAQIQHIGDQVRGKFTPVVDLAIVTAVLAPGGDVHLVDTERAIRSLSRATLGEPLLIVPDERRGIGHYRGGIRWRLGGQCHRVGPQADSPLCVENLVLVGLARTQARDKQLPDAGWMTQAHHMAAPIPAVEIA